MNVIGRLVSLCVLSVSCLVVGCADSGLEPEAVAMAAKLADLNEQLDLRHREYKIAASFLMESPLSPQDRDDIWKARNGGKSQDDTIKEMMDTEQALAKMLADAESRWPDFREAYSAELQKRNAITVRIVK